MSKMKPLCLNFKTNWPEIWTWNELDVPISDRQMKVDGPTLRLLSDISGAGSRWQWCWWHRYVGDFMMVTDFRCWWQNHYVGDFFRYVSNFLNVSNRSPTSWIDHQHHKLVTNTFGLQHRCNPSDTDSDKIMSSDMVTWNVFMKTVPLALIIVSEIIRSYIITGSSTAHHFTGSDNIITPHHFAHHFAILRIIIKMEDCKFGWKTLKMALKYQLWLRRVPF